MVSDALKKAIEKRKQMLENGERFATPLEKFLENPSMTKAVKMFCYECSGYSKNLANTCNNTDCALWLFKKGNIIDENALKVWRKSYMEHMKLANELNCEETDED